MNNTQNKTNVANPKSGFSLVEVSLAIFVVAIGLLGAYSLFPAGLNMNKNAIEDTEVALFAQEVFAGLHAQIEASPGNWNNPDAVRLEAITFGMWDGATVADLEMQATTTPELLKYVQWDEDIVERALWYTLEFGDVSPNVKFAILQVWNGEFNPRRPEEAAEFYTEFYNYGM